MGTPHRRGRYRLHPAPEPEQSSNTPKPATGAIFGGATRRGRVSRPDGPFVLRPDLPMPGALPVAEAAETVIRSLQAQAKTGQIADGTAETHTRSLRSLVAFTHAEKAELVCDLNANLLLRWQHAPDRHGGQPPTLNAQRARQAAASAFFHTCYRLGITDLNPAQSLPAVQSQPRYVHAFTEKQILRLKEHAASQLQDTRTPAAVALVLLGCSSGEVGAIRCADVDLTQKWVRAHGGSDRYAPRWLPIDDQWCFDALTARIHTLTHEHPDDWQQRTIAYTPHGSEPADDWRKAAAATSRTVTAALKNAGLKVDGQTRAASITEYVAARIFNETGRVEAVAARLGLTKLDDAAHICGYDWKKAYLAPGPDTEGDIAGTASEPGSANAAPAGET